jgi:hypothetical protein
VSNVVLNHLRGPNPNGTEGWLVTFLAEVERQIGVDPQTIAKPKGWEVVSEFTKFDATKLPAVVIAVGEIGGEPMRTGDGEYSAVFPCAVAVVTGGRTPAETERNAHAYGAAVRGAMLYHLDMERQLPVQGVKWIGETYAEIDTTDRRTKGATMVFFEIRVPDVARDYTGAPLGTTPPVDPYASPDAIPTVLTAEFDVETP